MSNELRKAVFTAIMVSLGTSSYVVSIAGADEAARYRSMLKEKSPSMVTIKYILKYEFDGMGDDEYELEVTGVVIDPKGLILCGNSQLGGLIGMMSRIGGEGIATTPTDLKVLIGGDTEGVAAELVARDTELDLAWVRLKKTADRPLDFVDFSKGADVDVGDAILAVRKMGKFFARAEVVNEGRIGGITKTPRRLYIPAGTVATSLGLPVYTTDGRVIGFTIQQMPEEDDMEADPMAVFGQLSGMQDAMMGMILPAGEVVKATKRAMESVESD